MTILLPYLILIVISFCLMYIFKLKSLESMLIGLCAIIVLLFIFAAFGILSMGVYVIIALVLLTAVYTIYLMIRNKHEIIKTVVQFFSPAMVALLLSITIYTILIDGVRLAAWDDASHWGLAVKVLYTLDGFPKEVGILGSQTNALPLFNYFIIKLAGYKESFMLSGLWLFNWVCILLPLAHIKWKKYKTVIIYSLIAYTLLIISRPVDAQSLMMDATLGIMSASLVAYYFINKTKTNKTNIIMIAGLIILPQTKRIAGLLFSLFVIAVYLYDQYSLTKIQRLSFLNRKNIIRFVTLLAIPFLSYFAHTLTKPIAKISSSEKILWCNPFGSIKSSVLSPIGIILTALILSTVIFIIFSFYKDKSYKKNLLYLGGFILFVFFGYLFVRLDAGSVILINAYIKNLLKVKIYSVFGYKLVSVMMIMYVLIYYIGAVSAKKKKYFDISIIFITQGIVYLLFMLVFYSKLSKAQVLNGASLDRYLSSFIVYVILACTAVLLFNKSIWAKQNYYVIFVGVLSFITILTFPKPLYIYQYQSNSPFESSLLGEIQYHSDRISSQTSDDDNVYLVTQGDTGFIMHWTNYHLFPRDINSSYFSLGPEKYENDLWSKDITPKEWQAILIEGKYTHLYVADIDEYFITTYSSLFDDNKSIISEMVYEISYDNDGNIKFID